MALESVVDELTGLDPAELSDTALGAEVLALRAHMDRQKAAFARLVAATHQRGVGAIDGSASTAAWLRSRAGMPSNDDHLPRWILEFNGHELPVIRPDGVELREDNPGGTHEQFQLAR